MRQSAEITVKFGDYETISLIKQLAAEVQDCYDHLDEMAAMIGGRPFPRNTTILEKIEEWGKSLREVSESA